MPPSGYAELEERVTKLEHALIGTMERRGLVHVQRDIAETVEGKDGNGGLVRDIQNLKLDRARGLAWVAGAAAAGSGISALVIWVLKYL